MAQEEQKILVRGSEEHKDYLKYQFGTIKGMVNKFETRIAVSGRALLLVYVVYITVRAGIGSALDQYSSTWVGVALLVLDIFMLALQVLGLEGSVPGLNHLADELEEKGKSKEAGTVRFASMSAQLLLGATAIDIVLQRSHYWGTFDITNIAIVYTNCLFILRVIAIGLYLMAMAKLEHKGPKVISLHEHEKQEKAKEQEQVRMDNASIQSAIGHALAQWTQQQKTELAGWFQQQSQALQSQTALNPDDLNEAMKPFFASFSAQMSEAIQRKNEATILENEAKMRQIGDAMLLQNEAKMRQGDAILRQENEALKRDFEAKMRQLFEVLKPKNEAKTPASQPKNEAEKTPLQFDTATASRKALKQEAYRLKDELSWNNSQISDRLDTPLKTIQRWFTERNQPNSQTEENEAEDEANEA